MDTEQSANEMFKETIALFITNTMNGVMEWAAMSEGEDRVAESNRLMNSIYKAGVLIATELKDFLQKHWITQTEFNEHVGALIGNVDFAEFALGKETAVPANTTIH